MEQMKQQHQHNNNMEMCCNEKKEFDLPRNFPIQALHPDKPIKEGVCPICRGDRIVKVLENGTEHYTACVCVEHKEDLQKCIDIMERIQKMQRENKNSDDNQTETEKIQWKPFHPNAPIEKGICPICRGERQLMAFIDGNLYFKKCSCFEKEITMQQLKKTGIAESIEKYTFENFQTAEQWQQRLKQKALKFLEEKDKWFFVGGQVGCGKTHICTAILGEFINQGKSVKYILWANEIVKLKANKMDDENYQSLINPLLTTQILYIDDFFKTEKGKKPSEADIRTAFEIINYRYVNKGLITIISSEKTVDDLIAIDETIGSRIHEKAKDYINIIIWEEGRNWRLRKKNLQ